MDIKTHLAEIVGRERVSDRIDDLQKFSAIQSLTESYLPKYAVSPKDTEEVQKIILLANEKKIAVVPFSSGIRLCDASLPAKDTIALDLSRRMNRIIKVDERNRNAQIEAGVTWQQLQPELEKRNLMPMSPLVPHPQKSVVTSYLEREPLVVTKHEYGDPLLTTEFVYPNGRIMRTGSAVVPGFGTNAISDGVFPAGPGIDHWRLLQGAQGTMGVVTWANVKVEYLPKVNKIFFIPFKTAEEAIRPIYEIQKRMIGLECFLLNSLNLASILTEKPQNIDELKKVLPEWTVVLVLSGGRRHPNSKLKYEEEVLGEISRAYSLRRILTELPNLPNAGKLLKMLRNCSSGANNYWKFAYHGSCHDIFFLTTLDRVNKFLSYLKQTLEKHKVATVGIYIQPIEYARACHFECNIFYNSSNLDHVESTKILFRELADNFSQLGAFFSRPYGDLAKLVFSKSGNYTSMLRKIKAFYDPNNILSPERLCFK